MKRFTNLFFILVGFTFSLVSLNASAKTPAYKIEVIVFESLALKGWTEEYWPEDTQLPDTNNSTSVYNNNTKPLWINNAGKSLNGKAAALNKKGYRVIFHKAWTQLAYPNKNTHKTMIEGSTKYGTSVMGTVRLYKTRFAHVDFDLEFDRLIPQKVKEEFAKTHNLHQADLPANWRFDLSESRKIRPGELHYIDHPLFGVLVQITPID